MEGGFEALMDASMLLTVLLVASTLAIAWGRPAQPDPAADGLRYAEETRAALFRTTLPGMGYATDEMRVTVPGGTSVETFLRIEVALRARDLPLDFSTANARIAEMTRRLVRPGWGAAVTGLRGDAILVRIPDGQVIPAVHYTSGWTYPPLDGLGGDVRLNVAVWLSPPR